MLQHGLTFRQARDFVSKARTNLGVSQNKALDWDDDLKAECTRLIEATHDDDNDSVVSKAPTPRRAETKKKAADKKGIPEGPTSPTSSATSTSNDGNDGDSIQSKCIMAAAIPKTLPKQAAKKTGKQQKRPPPSSQRKSSAGETRQTAAAKAAVPVGPQLVNSSSHGSCVDDFIDKDDDDDDNSEATAAEVDCNVSISDRDGDDNLDQMAMKHSIAVEKVIKQKKTVKKGDEESTLATLEEHEFDVPSYIYVVHDKVNLNDNRRRSITNQQSPKSKNVLNRLRKGFKKIKSKKKVLLDEDDEEAYEQTLVDL